MAVMRVAQIAEANGPFTIAERPIPEPGPGQVRIRVQACGVCHSDVITKTGGIPGIKFPIVPGHEIAGVIDALGAGIPGPRSPSGGSASAWALSWFGGNCGYCTSCRRSDFITCAFVKCCRCDPTTAAMPSTWSPRSRPWPRIPDDLNGARCRTTSLRRHHHLQRAAQQRRARGRYRRRAGLGRPRPSRRAIRASSSASAPWPSRGASARHRSPRSSARITTSTTRRRIRRQRSRKLGGARVILATITSATAMSPTIGGLTAARQAAGGGCFRRAHRGRHRRYRHGLRPLGRRLAFGHLDRFPKIR